MTDIATTASPARSIVFIDSRVQDAATLLQGLDPGTEVVFLQAGQDGLAQMAAALGDRGDVGAVQVIAHGSAGQLWLGSRFLDNTTLQQPEVQALLASLGRGLTAEGDLLIYACNTAEGSEGAQFVSNLAALTGADVAASDDRTGSAQLGGDWVLESASGPIEVQSLAFDYSGVLALAQVVGWPSASIYVRPGEASYTWTWGVDSSNANNYQITQVAFWNVPDSGFNWYLDYGHFEYSTNNGVAWTVYNESNSSITYIPTATTVWRFVDTNPVGSAPAAADRIGFGYYANGTGYGTSGFYIHEDAAPTDITASGSTVVSDMPANGTVAVLTPTDTGLTTQGTWVIDSQSHSGLFTLDFNPSTGNTATLKVPDPSKFPADGEQVSITVTYRDIYQTDTAGQPIPGQGVSKTFTFEVKGATNDLNFTPDIAVNNPAADTASQSYPAIAAWANGQFVVAWTDATNGGVYAQRFDGQGGAQGTRLTIDAATGAKAPSSVVALAGGKFAVVYADAVSKNIQFRIVDGSGAVGPTNTIAADEWDEWSPIGVAPNTAGDRFLVTWNKGDYTVKSAVFTDAGVQQDSIQTLPNLGYSPASALLANGSQVIASVDAVDWVGIRLAVGGTTINPSAVIGDTGSMPGLAALSGGGFVLTWASGDWTHVYAQVFNNAGSATSSLLNVNTAAGTVGSPRVAALSDGSFVVSWNSADTDGSGTGVSGRRFSSDGTPIDATQFQINQLRYGDQNYAVVAALDNGRFAAAWEDSVAGKPTGSDIEARVLLSSGLQEAPVVATPSSITLADTAAADTFSNTTGTLSATDSDGIASYGIQSGFTGGSTNIGGVAYDVSKVGTYGTLYVVSTGANIGKYVYVPNTAAVNTLASGSTSETFTVTATDGNASPATGTATLTVNVTGANDTPTGVTLSSATTNQSGSVNAVVGTLSASDADAGQSHVYTLVSGVGDTDNTFFNISGNTLRASNAATMAPGTYSVRLQVSDGTDTYAKDFTITVVDDIAPVTTIDSVSFSADTGSAGTDFITRTAAQTISGTLSANLAAGERVEISLNNGANWSTADATVGSSTWSQAATLGGSNTLQVRVVDDAGNSGPTLLQAYVLDTTAPPAPSTPDLDTASDTGVSSADNITNDTTPTFTGTAEAGSTVSLYDTYGSTLLGEATADGSGNWSITSSALLPGVHTLTAKATDSAGNVSIASAGLTVTVDTNPPSKPAAPVLATASDVGQSNSDGITNLTSLTLQGAAGSVEANAKVHALSSLDGGLTNTVANADGSWSLNVTGLAQGTHQLQINATDAAGNTSTYSDASTVVIDTTAPTLAITSNVSALKTGETATITFTFSEDPGSTFTWDGNAGDVVASGGTLSAISGSGLTRMATFTPTAGIDSSTASITVAAGSYNDVAGNFGGAGTTPTLIVDTLAPSTTAVAFLFGVDTGSSSTDLVTRVSAQTISGSLSAPLATGESVEVSLDDGGNWSTATASVGSSSWSLTANLGGSNTLHVRVKDAAGNVGPATTQAYVLDTTAPVFQPATGNTPADDASAVPVTDSLMLSFSETLSTVDSTKVYLRDVATDTLVPASISINSNGALVINPTGNLAYGTAYYVTWDADALRDTAGNSALAVSDKTSYNFTTQAAPSTPTTPTEPVPVPVDGAQVTTQTGADGTITTTIAPVTSGRVDDPNTPNATLADVPLFQSGGNPVLLASLPVGFGLSASTPGLSTAGNSLTDLIRQIQQHTAAGSQDQSQMTSGGTDFLGGLPSTTPLLVQTIVPTYQGSGMPGQALGISGQPATPGGPLTALVIDASGLPPSTSLQLNNVEFAAIIGAVSVSGGAGSQHVWGDSANQTILLGADDDILHGGGGNDTVGSLGGNDQVFGDDGDDIVFGGTGHDTLSGGTGNDHLDGGVGWDTALQSGSLSDYTLSQAGNALLLTHKTTGEVDHLKSVEMVKFDTGTSLYIADSDAEAAIAHIATKWLGRDLSAEEGAEFQAYSHLTALEVAQAVLRGPYGEQLQGHTAEELIAGWQDNPQILRMDVVSEVVQGSTGVDAINYGVKLADAHLQWVSDGVWEGTNVTNGDMAQLHSIERVHFSDASVALDGANLAALIAVTLGEASLQDRAITSEGLALMDSGWSNQAIGAAALQLAMGAGTHTAEDTVQWLWTKAYGSAGTAEQLQPYVQQLQSGATTVGDLAWEAAQYAQANPQVGLAGVQQQGLVYDAVVA